MYRSRVGCDLINHFTTAFLLAELKGDTEAAADLSPLGAVSRRALRATRVLASQAADLNKRQIVDFKMKSWAEPFLVLRAALYHATLSQKVKIHFYSGLLCQYFHHDIQANLTLLGAIKDHWRRYLDFHYTQTLTHNLVSLGLN